MKYFCVAIDKEIFDKSVFTKREEAIEYFNSCFYDELTLEWQIKEQEILESIARYDEKLALEDADIDKISKKINEKKAELLRLQDERRYCYFEWRGDCKNILRIVSVYKIAGELYEVYDIGYKVVSGTVECESAKAVFEMLPDKLKGEHVAMICIPKDGSNIIKIKNFISKTKMQLMKEHRKMYKKENR